VDGYTYTIEIDTNGNVVLPKLEENAKGAKTAVEGLGNKGGKSMGLLTNRVNRTNTGLNRMRSLVAGIGLTLSAGAIATGLVKLGAGYEQSMSNVQALSNATRTEMVSLRKSVRDAGATTEHTARASADAMGYLAMAGFKTNQMVSALPGTLNLASAGNMDLARSADIATNVLSQYRMKASETGVVVDQLAFTQSNFNTNISEAAEAMNYWGSTAKALNISLAESNATIGLLANNGLKGSLGTRALGSSVVRLAKPTKAMNRVIKDLNLSLYNSEGRFVGMAGMVSQLNNRMSGFTDKQKQSALATLFGAEAIQEINILMAEGADKIRYWTGELENSEGTAKRIAEMKLDNLAGDFKILRSTTEEFGLSLYEQISPTLRIMTKQATLFVRSLDTKQAGLYLKKTVGFLYSTGKFLKDNWKTLVKIGKVYVVLKAGMLAYNTSMRIGSGLSRIFATGQMLMQGGLRASTSAMIGFNTACNLNPIIATASLVVSGITMVAGAMALFRDRTREAGESHSRLQGIHLNWQNRQKYIKDIDKEFRVDSYKFENSKLNKRQLSGLGFRLKQRQESLEDKLIENHVDGKYLSDKFYNLNHMRDKLQLARRKRQSYAILQNGLKLKTSDYFDSTGSATDRYRNLLFKMNQVEKQVYKNDESEQAIRDLIGQNNRLLTKVKPLLPKEESFEPETSIPNAEKMSAGISSGGSSQKLINITVPKFQDKTVFNCEGSKEDILNHVDELFDAFKSNLARVLNSAVQL
jgi:TP901 family phage tail tape measure protein